MLVNGCFWLPSVYYLSVSLVMVKTFLQLITFCYKISQMVEWGFLTCEDKNNLSPNTEV